MMVGLLLAFPLALLIFVCVVFVVIAVARRVTVPGFLTSLAVLAGVLWLAGVVSLLSGVWSAWFVVVGYGVSAVLLGWGAVMVGQSRARQRSARVVYVHAAPVR